MVSEALNTGVIRSNDSYAASAMTSEASDPEIGLSRDQDAALVDRVRAGDANAFSALVDEWVNFAYDLVCRRGVPVGERVNVVATSFAAVHRSLMAKPTSDPFRVLIARSTSRTIAASGFAHDASTRVATVSIGNDAEQLLADVGDVSSLANDPLVAEMIWQAATALGPQNSALLDLYLRHGFTVTEIAEVVHERVDVMSESIATLPAAFAAVVQAQVVWRRGNPRHPALASEVSAGPMLTLESVASVVEHQQTCGQCRAASHLAVDPVAVFASVPVLAIPAAEKSEVIEGLAAVGVALLGAEALGMTGALGTEVPTNVGGNTSIASSPPGPTAIVATTTGNSPTEATKDSSDRGKRLLLFGLAAIIAVVVGLVVVLFRGSHSLNLAALTAASGNRPVITASEPSSTDVSEAPIVSDQQVSNETDASVVSTSTSSTATTAISAPESTPVIPTTAEPYPTFSSVSVVIENSAKRSGWDLSSATAARVTWQISTDQPVTVQVTGPGLTSSSASGSVAPCPGTVTGTSCVADVATYAYRVVVTDHLGRIVLTRTVQLSVVAPVS